MKEINRLVSKGMSTITIEKNWHSQNFHFSLKENLKKCDIFHEQKRISYGKMFILALPSSAVFCLQNRVLDFF